MLVFLFFTTGPEKILTRNPNRTSSFWIKEPDETPNCLITKMILYWIGIVSMQVLLIKNAEVKLSKFSELQFNIAQNPALKHTHTHTHTHSQPVVPCKESEPERRSGWIRTRSELQQKSLCELSDLRLLSQTLELQTHTDSLTRTRRSSSASGGRVCTQHVESHSSLLNQTVSSSLNIHISTKTGSVL